MFKTLERFGKRIPLVSSGALACALFSLGAGAQRLPQNVHPEHYTLSLAPDLKAATFSGTESIQATLAAPANTITLNAAEITFLSVTATVSGKTLPADVSLDPDKEQATLTFPQQLPAGSVTLNIRYTGILNNELRGFYLSKTARRNYAVTQFEATDARRAFPSFDEPAMKATFDISLVVDKSDTAISNTNIIGDTPAAEGKHTLHFATTPKMSTYLVAFLVGDFACTSGEADGVPIRSCATPDKVESGKFALRAAEYVLHYYDTYFGIKYPMPKLDMIALPDFEAGAMENFGAITYRETDLLIDEKTASETSRKNVALVVAHEMAHQWFGDMVTMQWWNNLWLNEGFASWMENKPVAAWRPDWKIPEDVAEELGTTLNLDAQKSTRTIRAEANTPDEINEMFDGITYGKAGAVLLMVENYLGEETFRQGVHNYLAAHLYGNATAEDFWSAQTANSHKPVDAIMSSFVALPGVPVLHFERANNGKVTVSQDRFFLNAKDATEGENGATGSGAAWTVPVCFKASTAGAGHCDILQQPQQELPTPSAPFFFGDAAGTGYYRTAYDPADYKKILAGLETGLNPIERITFVNGQFALTRAGEAGIGDFLDLSATLKADTSPVVLETVRLALHTTDVRIAATSEQRAQLHAWARQTYGPVYARLGEPAGSDTLDKRELRAKLMSILGDADDPKVIAQATEIARKDLADPASVDASLARPALSIAASHGDAALFDQIQKTYETTNDAIQKASALRAMVYFNDPGLERRALDYVVSEKVRNQDSILVLSAALRNENTRDTTWQYVQQNWTKVQGQLTTAAGSYLVTAADSFCSVEARDQVAAFFGAHKVHASADALVRTRNTIDACIELRAEQGPKLQQWLASQPSLSSAASKGN